MPYHTRYVFPFTAIVGQEKMKKALLLNAINPKIGGVLIRGQKGTGKSTAVRALADLLPEIKVVEACPFNCNPDNPLEMCDLCYERYSRGEELKWIKRKVKIVNLPLNATIDRVVGSLDIKRALKEGIKALEPGLLAEANRGILYIDEVNLLDDYIVDVLLDVAASGVNIVERENISVSHPSRFILIGTMNPEEGELRPQLLDRFGLQVEVEPVTDPRLQVEIVKRVEEFEYDPLGFIAKYEDKQKELRLRIENARRLLPNVQIPEDLLYEIANICSKLAVSNRAPIVLARTAKTIAAFSGREIVKREDIMEAIELALPHRMRRRPFEQPHLPREKIEELLSENSREDPLGNRGSNQGGRGDKSSGELLFGADPTIDVRIESRWRQSTPLIRSGRSTAAKLIGGGRGAYIYSVIPRGEASDIAIDATIRAAAARAASCGNAVLEISEEDIREKVRRVRASSLVILVVDASGSMAAQRRMEAAKGAALRILENSYTRRDRVAFIAFRGNTAEILLPPTNSVDLAQEALRELPTGGRTPLPHALLAALNLIERERRKAMSRGFDLKPLVVLITDGRANVSLSGNIRQEIVELCSKLKEIEAQLLVIDVSEDPFAPSYIGDIVKAADARYLKIESLTDSGLQEIIVSEVGGNSA
ncbi:magnesium chelatase subunit D family protein, partial [Thermofilum sp.]|uniref:magnesium chelatase subunit D family protein n=1 Tax=Thermofilum sp. TaxID=1961369 RepID=UPI0031661E95